jgi:excinuclease ABC subunit A
MTASREPNERPDSPADPRASVFIDQGRADDEVIELRGVRTHNLHAVDVDIPRFALTVVSGVSGSGKSSLAFDTLYAEGQRRYTESLSTYARQFLQQMERPPVDEIRNVQPALALRQKNDVSNARSTVSTITELDDHLQLVFSHAGVTHCPNGHGPVRRDTVANVVDSLLELEEGTRVVVVGVVEATESEHRSAVLKQLVQEGYRRLYLDRETVEIDDASELDRLLDLERFPVVVDRLSLRPDDKQRIAEAVETGFGVGRGRIEIWEHDSDREGPHVFDQAFRCNACAEEFVEPQPALFTFNSSLGACPNCNGFGKTIGLDFKKVIPNPNLSILDGAVAAFGTPKYSSWQRKLVEAMRDEGIPLDIPYRKLDRSHQRFIREGRKGSGWKGIRGFFKDLQKKQYKTHIRIFLAKYRGYDDCEACKGTRLSAEARNVRFHDLLIADFWDMRVEQAREWFHELEMTELEEAAVGIVVDEIRDRLDYLDEVGVGYLPLGRPSRTLSGGEMQRIHLTTSLGRSLTDTLYVLDEPTAGLHARDSAKLLEVLYRLRDLGNTVVVVEHDPEIIRGGDYVVELGPLGGEKGGNLVFQGDMETFREADTLTSRSLEARLVVPGRNREPATEFVRIVGALENNLDNLTVDIPHERLTAVTGVSGSGKSTLMHAILYNGWRRSQGQGGVDAGTVEALEGLEGFDEVVMMDQAALGRSSRSNPMSYTKAYDDIRKVFADTRSAKLAGLTAGDFSFNSPGGRCEDCQGLGYQTIDMHFIADVEVLCETCNGHRFTKKVLDVDYRGHNIYDVFRMTVDEGVEFFEGHTALLRKLRPLQEVGLGYVRMGQTTSTLSGGEAQRVKLATYIAAGNKRGDTRPVFFIFDEPTVGLHYADVETLVRALRKLIELGHTVAVIEHNIDLIAQCDHVIDLGPDAGPRGGKLVATGTPEEVATVEESVTGKYLREYLS